MSKGFLVFFFLRLFLVAFTFSLCTWPTFQEWHFQISSAFTNKRNYHQSPYDLKAWYYHNNHQHTSVDTTNITNKTPKTPSVYHYHCQQLTQGPGHRHRYCPKTYSMINAILTGKCKTAPPRTMQLPSVYIILWNKLIFMLLQSKICHIHT